MFLRGKFVIVRGCFTESIFCSILKMYSIACEKLRTGIFMFVFCEIGKVLRGKKTFCDIKEINTL